jgi:anti-anti-sigma factor
MSSPQAKSHFNWADVGGVVVVTFATLHLREERVIMSVFDGVGDLVTAGKNRIVIDFTGLTTFASYAIGKLISLERNIQAANGRLALCELPPIVDEIVNIMNLRKKFNIYKTERDALESFV